MSSMSLSKISRCTESEGIFSSYKAKIAEILGVFQDFLAKASGKFAVKMCTDHFGVCS